MNRQSSQVDRRRCRRRRRRRGLCALHARSSLPARPTHRGASLLPPESIAVRPQLTGLPVLQEILGHHPEVPEAVATSEALDDLATAPAIPLFEYSYSQTPDSVAEVADVTREMRDQVLFAKVWLPLGLAAAAALSLAVGLAVFLRRRPRPLDLSGLYDRSHDQPPARRATPSVVGSTREDRTHHLV